MKPQVRAFKNELRNYRFYQERIDKLNELIEFCYTLLPGAVHGIDLADVRVHGIPNKDREYKIRDEITRHEENLKRTEEKKKYLDEILNEMETSLREAIIAVYCDGIRMMDAAEEFNLSTNGLQYRINCEIERALNGKTDE